MDKVKVNNQIVKMRKHVKRARLFAINKFTKQVKLLQSKKGSDNQAEKNQRKVERMLEKIKILKKMVPDLVSKQALSKEKDWSSILAKKNIPLEDQCLALLANDKEVQKEVEKFHSEESELAAKVPSLLLEWEMKSMMPKTPDKTKKASDIRKLKMDKIAKRKKNNFKDATFPNNVPVNKKPQVSDNKKKKLSGRVSDIAEDEEEVVSDKNDLSVSESGSDIEDGETDEFFTKTDENSKSHIKNRELTEDGSDKNDQSDLEDDSDGGSGDFFMKSVGSSKNQTENSESMEYESDRNNESDSESSNNNSESESEETLTKITKNKKDFLFSKKVKNSGFGSRQTNRSLSSRKDDEDKSDVKNSFSSKELTENLSSGPQSSIFERLNAIANTDTQTLIAKKRKSNKISQKTKAIKTLDLNELQDVDQIPIQDFQADSQEPDDAPAQTVVPKKDSFFLNGNDEVQSSEDESDVNNFKPKSRFSNFNRSERGGKFRKNGFGDTSHKSFRENRFNQNKDDFRNRSGKSFNRFENRRGRDFKHGESRFQNKSGKDFNQNESRFRNRKGNDFDKRESRFEKYVKGNSKFNDRKKFGSKEGVFHHSQAKTRDSSLFKRENKKNLVNESFQSKKQPGGGEETNAHLHPSWEAKKKLKEAAKSGFQGKRILFD